MATAFETAPWLMVIGRHKASVFIAVGVMLAVNYRIAIVRPRRMNCAPGEVCHVDSRPMRVTRVVFWTSVLIYAAAVSFTYAASWWLRVQS